MQYKKNLKNFKVEKMDKNVIFHILSVVKTRNKFCLDLRFFANNKKQFKLSKYAI